MPEEAQTNGLTPAQARLAAKLVPRGGTWAEQVGAIGRAIGLIAVIAYALSATIFLTKNFSQMVNAERSALHLLGERMLQWKK